MSRADKYEEYLKKYIDAGSVLNLEFAKMLLANQRPICSQKKDLIIFDNTKNYCKITGDPSQTENYYLTIRKRERFNADVRSVFSNDTSGCRLVLLNELLGRKPQALYQYQKLINTLKALYDETDAEAFAKVRIHKKESMEERDLGNRYTKHLLILAPEWYKWMNDNSLRSVTIQDIYYEYKDMLNEEEYHNYFTICSSDMNSQRPYFKKAIRSGGKRKETTPEMAKDLNYFLYGTE